MKKSSISLVVASAVLLFSSPAYAAAPAMVIDGITLQSDVQPEVQHSRTMVPLRIIGENLGAKVNWANSEATLTYNGITIKLKPNSSAATKNGEPVALDAEPYLKNNRIYVPLRFIAETFGSTIDYRDGTVTVDTEPLTIEGVPVKAALHEIYATMGSIVNQIGGNAHIAALYQLLEENKGQEVEAPASYSWSFHLVDTGGYYVGSRLDFVDGQGASLQSYALYFQLGENSDVMLYDATKSQWHEFSTDAKDAIWQEVGLAGRNGFMKEISNTVP
ncbi:copper amine oxidase N-terminal domain-containing protein [Cohnella fermenti]|uniref:Copper amine oxidase N-terminal domain-containing protein n=1 Tax=Cohnella fermenti TaxID=2565925 RepID=A0A4S4CAN2_9BACL|nr:copper amine oxidase N-terminal domain-containing protein [Cohnella fermenti]THF84508.1 copper amine oxidase N-terminal domain-containing protein [Cohnella fermenti]